MSYAYAAADQLTTLTYPGNATGGLGEAVSRIHNPVGQLDQVISQSDSIHFVASTLYLATGQVWRQRLDQTGGADRYFSYYAGVLRLNEQKAGTISPWTDRQQLTYAYDAAGNVTSFSDGQNSSQVQSYGYDWLDRLVSASTNAAGTGQYNQSYVYNAIGNLTNYAGNPYTYGTKPHAVTAAYGNSYAYDGNGNQTSRTIGGVVYTFTYDYENRLTGISGGSVSASFVYDADGNRVKGTVGGVNTVYVDGLYEWQNGATTKYYAGHSGVVAMRRTGYASSNGVFYILSDQLQSTSRILAQSNAIQATQHFYPFGGNRGGVFSTLTTKRFTGQYHESSIPGGEGLSYYNARWYDAKLGRFVSADTLVPNPGNPQSFNRYAYVLNNPLKYTDPSGHDPIGPAWERWFNGCASHFWKEGKEG